MSVMYKERKKSKHSRAVNGVFDVIERIVTIVELIDILAFLAKAVYQFIEESGENSITYILKAVFLSPVTIGLFVILVLLIITDILLTVHITKRDNIDFFGFMQDLHEEFIHEMRNHIHQLENITVPSYDVDDEKAISSFNREYNVEYKELQKITKQCVDQVSHVINNLMGIDYDDKGSICACIKMVSIDDEKLPIEKKSLWTIARSENTDAKRKKSSNSMSVIGANEDFLNLSNGYQRFYSNTDLTKKYNAGKYRNSTPNFMYESTIVVPIRYNEMKSETINLPSDEDEKKRIVQLKLESHSDIAGYLCIDSTEVFKEWDDTDEVMKIVNILAVYADLLYIYLTTFKKTFKVIDK